jgi:hypothetical protein
MLFDKRPIQRAVVTIRGTDGATLSLVTFTDGAYGIARNGEPLDGCRWPEEELDACIARLLRLAGKTDDCQAREC